MLKFYKILFINSLIAGTLISISSFSWLSMWMGLEINLLSIIPLMKMKNNIFNTEAQMKYFTSQAMASIILLFSILLISANNFMFLDWLMILLNSSLLTKMGAAPLHFWFPQVLEGLEWPLSLTMLTWQKIAPFILLSYNISFSTFFLMVMILSSLIGSISGLNQVSMRKILTFSSINHISWMLASMLNSLTLWIFYFTIYCLISMNIIFIMNSLKIFYLKQLILKLNFSKNLKLFFMMNFFSLGGLPPFLGFFPKWLTINFMMNSNFWMLSIILIMCSLITLFFYTRITMSSLIINHKDILFMPMKFNFFLLSSFNFLNLSGLLFLTLMFFLN